MPSTTSRPPLTRFTTPGGSPSASSSSNAICCVSGTCSDGLRMNVLPQAIANGRNQNGTIAGKLNGTIAAHTPTGWRMVSASMLRETSSRIRPCIVVGIAHAASTISIMRATSARASTSVLPISVVTDRARSSWRATRRSRSSKSLRARAIDADRPPLGQRCARAAEPRRRGRRPRTAGRVQAPHRWRGWSRPAPRRRSRLSSGRRRSCRAGEWWSVQSSNLVHLAGQADGMSAVGRVPGPFRACARDHSATKPVEPPWLCCAERKWIYRGCRARLPSIAPSTESSGAHACSPKSA